MPAPCNKPNNTTGATGSSCNTSAKVKAEDRRQRRIARLLKQSGLPDGKSLGNLDEALLPEKIQSDFNYPRCWKAALWNRAETCWHLACRAGGRVILWPP